MVIAKIIADKLEMYIMSHEKQMAVKQRQYILNGRQ